MNPFALLEEDVDDDDIGVSFLCFDVKMMVMMISMMMMRMVMFIKMMM